MATKWSQPTLFWGHFARSYPGIFESLPGKTQTPSDPDISPAQISKQFLIRRRFPT